MSSIYPPSFFLQTFLHQAKKAEVNIEINKSVLYIKKFKVQEFVQWIISQFQLFQQIVQQFFVQI